ncbi:hypothetical protein E2C01_058394 [Portunus trituberculatus]|uniref:Uncharacterized protein n=1 Tax=Portunus trituberculatus TaxID=210409 RepID=A0A5B7GZQ7_PORTR|nr:hypothetical protein [Portunus trituberculatus]
MCDSEGHMSDAFAAVQRRSWLVLQLGEQSIGPNPPPGRGRGIIIIMGTVPKKPSPALASIPGSHFAAPPPS